MTTSMLRTMLPLYQEGLSITNCCQGKQRYLLFNLDFSEYYCFECANCVLYRCLHCNIILDGSKEKRMCFTQNDLEGSIIQCQICSKNYKMLSEEFLERKVSRTDIAQLRKTTDKRRNNFTEYYENMKCPKEKCEGNLQEVDHKRIRCDTCDSTYCRECFWRHALTQKNKVFSDVYSCVNYRCKLTIKRKRRE